MKLFLPTRAADYLSDTIELVSDDVIMENGEVLYRIRASVDFPEHGVKRGDLGGYVTCPENVRVRSWVEPDARIVGMSPYVTDSAVLKGSTTLLGRSVVSFRAKIHNSMIVDSLVSDTAKVGESWVEGSSSVRGGVVLQGSTVRNRSVLTGDAWVEGCEIDEHSSVDSAQVERTLVSKFSRIAGPVLVQDSTVVNHSKVVGHRELQLRDGSVVEHHSSVLGNVNVVRSVVSNHSTVDGRANVLAGNILERSVVTDQATLHTVTLRNSRVQGKEKVRLSSMINTVRG